MAFETQRLEHKLVGATVVVVKDGSVLFSKGYGFANLEKRIHVDANKHLFRIASVSKPFTWAAVLKLVEEGKLDLNVDIQNYLDFKIPSTFDEPIRLRNLFTHTAGFEEQGTGGFAKSSEDVLTLKAYLSKHMPARVRKSGTFISYSNYGSALAGYIVQRVTGVPWADYIQRNILDPLDMVHTNLYQPMSIEHKENHASGYKFENGRYMSTDFWYEHEAPAGIISSTAGDMAHWMLMLLNGGQYQGRQVLAASVVEKMRAALFQQHPSGLPVLHGFYRSDQNGLEVFGRGGDVNQFHSNLTFIPSENLSIFVSYNSDPSAQARSNVVKAFINYFFPQPYAPVTEPNLAVDVTEYVGTWTSTRRNHSTFEKLALLMSQMQTSTSDGELLVHGRSGTSRWIALEKDVFRAKYGNRKLLFYRSENGDVTHFSGEGGLGSIEVVPWFENRGINIFAFSFVLLVSLVYIFRFAYRLILETNFKPILDQWLGFVSSLFMVFLIYRLAVTLTGDTDAFLYGLPDSVALIFKLTLVFAILGFIVVLLSIRQWWLQQGAIFARLNYSILAMAIILFLYLLWFWNILFHYLA